jgi:DNA-binding PadR family transcriptional regulator
MSEIDKILQNFQQEMKRGILVLAVLSQLDEAQYGYSLIQALTNLSMPIEQNTLYPLLRRLEKQGLLDSLWQVEENRPRRYYKISDLGIEVRKVLLEEWNSLEITMKNVIGGLK